MSGGFVVGCLILKTRLLLLRTHIQSPRPRDYSNIQYDQS